MKENNLITKTQHAIQNSAHLPEYQIYFEQEHNLVKNFAYGNLLDVGCGECRPLQQVYRLITHYYGFDCDAGMLEHVQKNLPSDIREKTTLIVGDANNLSKYITSVDTTICLWNTLSVMGDNKEAHLLSEMGKVTTGNILIALAAKNEKTFSIRKRYYETMGVEYHIDETTQTIRSEVWGASRAYAQKDLETLAKTSELKLEESGFIGDLGIYGIYKKR
jgi:ubiquinone/menaquinone biosynthesis C-methylase UbiE